MRGNEDFQDEAFSYISAEKRVPQDHPLRAIRRMTDEALRGLSKKLDGLYATTGRPSIPPEQLLRGLLLQVLYSVRSERLLMEQMDYNLLFRWFVGLRMDDEVWDVTVFTKNRDRLIEGEIAEGFFQEVLQQARTGALLSDEHFTVDGTLLEAWANRDSFKEKKDPPAKGTGARGRKLLRDTHASSTDGEARIYKQSAAEGGQRRDLWQVVEEEHNGEVGGERVWLDQKHSWTEADQAARGTAGGLGVSVCGSGLQLGTHEKVVTGGVISESECVV